jgi:hypothetical protein
MRNDERTFQIYNLEIAAQKAGASVPTMSEAIAVWQKLRAAGRTYPIQAGDGTMLIGQIEVRTNDQIAILLIRLSDKNAPNSVYSDPDNGDFIEHEKTGNVGADFACHVIISLAPEIDQANVYTCGIERIAGLSPGLVQRILSKFFNYEYHDNEEFFKYPSPGGGLTKDGQPKFERCCPHVELRGRPSQTMINDINNGHLSGISLVRSEQVTPIAGAPYLIKSHSELRLTIDRANMPAQVWNSVQHALQANSGNYGQAKVSYRIPGSKRTVTVELNSHTGLPLSDLYFQSFDVRPIFPPLAQSTHTITPRLVDPAVQQVLLNRTI